MGFKIATRTGKYLQMCRHGIAEPDAGEKTDDSSGERVRKLRRLGVQRTKSFFEKRTQRGA